MLIKLDNHSEFERLQHNNGRITNNSSIHSASISEIHEIPIDIIITPFKSNLDEHKIESIIENLRNEQTERNIPPIDVLWIEGSEGGNYFYGFSGLHRLEAHKVLGDRTVRAKLIKSCLADLKYYLGGSTPKYLK